MHTRVCYIHKNGSYRNKLHAVNFVNVLNVRFQARLSCEISRADLALELLDVTAGVRSRLVTSHVALLGELLAANVTLVLTKLNSFVVRDVIVSVDL